MASCKRWFDSALLFLGLYKGCVFSLPSSPTKLFTCDLQHLISDNSNTPLHPHFTLTVYKMRVTVFSVLVSYVYIRTRLCSADPLFSLAAAASAISVPGHLLKRQEQAGQTLDDAAILNFALTLGECLIVDPLEVFLLKPRSEHLEDTFYKQVSLSLARTIECGS